MIYFLPSLVSFLILGEAFEHLRRFQFLGFRFLVRGFMKNMDISFGDIFRVIEYNFFFFFSGKRGIQKWYSSSTSSLHIGHILSSGFYKVLNILNVLHWASIIIGKLSISPLHASFLDKKVVILIIFSALILRNPGLLYFSVTINTPHFASV